jgi:hypothetical protein
VKTILLLLGSNVFMTIAWYGHLRHKATDLWKVILGAVYFAFATGFQEKFVR